MTVHVLVSSYAEERIGERLSDSRHPSLEEAQACGETLRAKGVCVIVRPTYNETDRNGRFFREWRSFDGAEFIECRWPEFIESR